MSWSQSKIRKWYRDNPGKSRIGNALRRAFQRSRVAMEANIIRSNPLLRALMKRQ